ncbi:MAG: hypothetical protein QOH36_489 [Actinomycetota bacterium]|nr:hypothetical protein [Actinomycetota bacterium]
MLNRAEGAGSEVTLAASVRRCLVAVTVGLAVLTMFHDVDHVRQGRGLPVELYFVAVFALVSIGVTLTVLLRRHPVAAPVAFVQGVATIVGVAAVHVAPQWSSVTDSYGAAHADLLSWAIIAAMMTAGLTLALVATTSTTMWARETIAASRVS